ncbi:Bug family tripartite tricarboxylate transporter substrate binding protein [Hydrogenophaga sp. BPS33]|uniref:Bug family tripartite tricarboxylate transporter substrate binding protein n=1 Tax=Hydrogenophaga sp. BPS33 TaxID=2651974 RepID=UPI00135819A3|nr:tripartite tricarboxylate transporter substrate-binding protein [Hydrogenophaga sp. BPS33]
MKPTRPGRALFLAMTLSAPLLAAAQAYPAKPVRFVTASVGSPQDVVGRIFAQKIGETWGQPIVVDNRAGAGSLLSIQHAAKAPADGYTVLISSTAYAVTPFLYKELGYDANKDLVPVALLATTPNILVTSPNSGIRTLKEAVERARQGRDLRYGSPGFGTTPQLSAEYLFKVLAKVNTTHVPYKGIPGTLQATLGNEVDLSSTALPPAAPLVKSGRLVGLAVTSSKRSAALPDVPTVGEAGFTDFEDDSWVGVWVPAGTPAPVIAQLREALGAAAKAEDVRGKLANVGFETGSLTPSGFEALVQKELRKWDKIVKETGTKVE